MAARGFTASAARRLRFRTADPGGGSPRPVFLAGLAQHRRNGARPIESQHGRKGPPRYRDDDGARRSALTPPLSEPHSTAARTIGLYLNGPRALEPFGGEPASRRPLKTAYNLAKYLGYCGASAVVLPEELADRHPPGLDWPG